MDKSIMFFIILLSSFNLLAQEVVVSTPSSSGLYLDIANPVNLAVEGMECEDLSIKIDNGWFEGNHCKYVIYPNKKGYLKMSVINKKGELIDEYSLPVLNLNLKAVLKGPTNFKGKLLIGKLIGIVPEVDQVDLIPDNYELKYEAIILRGNEVIFKETFSNKFFNDELKNELNRTIRNDIILFTKIIVRFNNQVYKLNDIVLDI